MIEAESTDKAGLTITEIDALEFKAFANRYANSPEIGPIGTCLDSDAHPMPEADLRVIGLKGCGRICAAATFQLFDSKLDPSAQVLKLDSVVVDPKLRRRGLGGVLVAKAFGDMVGDTGRRITRIYAHSVHPATVSMLKRLGFSDPPSIGAPITDTGIDESTKPQFLNACEENMRGRLEQMRLQCAFCRKGDKRARPWCRPQ
jgi:GNAT superfamily N-acetyltransferase